MESLAAPDDGAMISAVTSGLPSELLADCVACWASLNKACAHSLELPRISCRQLESMLISEQATQMATQIYSNLIPHLLSRHRELSRFSSGQWPWEYLLYRVASLERRVHCTAWHQTCDRVYHGFLDVLDQSAGLCTLDQLQVEAMRSVARWLRQAAHSGQGSVAEFSTRMHEAIENDWLREVTIFSPCTNPLAHVLHISQLTLSLRSGVCQQP